MDWIKPLVIAFNVLCAGDAATTHYALSTGKFQEQILSQSPWTDDAIIAGEATAMDLSILVVKRRHPKWALALLVVGVSIRGYAVAHNLHEIGVFHAQ